MEPWQSWVAALVVGGGLAYYYTKDTNVASKISHTVQGTEQPQASTAKRRQEKPSSRSKSTVSNVAGKTKEAVDTATEATSTAVSNAVNPPKKKKAGKENVPAKAVEPTPQTTEDDEADEDSEWAAQLDAKKKGVSLSGSAAVNRPAKAKKPKSSQEMTTNGESSMNFVAGLGKNKPDYEESSTTTSAPVGGDVSDMLEARGPALSVLRIVGEEKPKKQQAPKAEVETETKKQRQNRRKVEEQRAVREQQERERQALLEKQRRTAREARGEPAKNGLAPSKAPTSNAWSASSQPTANADEPVPQSNGVSLLDTFDHDNVSTASSNEVATSVTTPATAPSTAEHDYPSGEAQLEQLNEMDGWAEVSKSKKGKKKAQAPTEESTAPEVKNDFVPPIPRGTVKTAVQPAPVQKAKPQAATNGFAALEEPATYVAPVKGHPDDSDWL